MIHFKTMVGVSISHLVLVSAHAESFTFSTEYENLDGRTLKISYSGGLVENYSYGQKNLSYFNAESYDYEFRPAFDAKESELNKALTFDAPRYQGSLAILHDDRWLNYSNPKDISSERAGSHHLLELEGGKLKIEVAAGLTSPGNTTVLSVDKLELVTSHRFGCTQSVGGVNPNNSCFGSYTSDANIRVQLDSGKVIRLRGDFDEMGDSIKGYDFKYQKDLLELHLSKINPENYSGERKFIENCKKDFYEDMLEKGVPSIKIRGTNVAADEVWVRKISRIDYLKVISSDLEESTLLSQKSTLPKSKANIDLDDSRIADTYNNSLQPLARKLFETFFFEARLNDNSGQFSCEVVNKFSESANLILPYRKN